MEISFVTSNVHKVSLANSMLSKYGIDVKQLRAELAEIQSLDVAEVAVFKARQLAKDFTEPFIVEDSGLYIDVLNGFPGALMKPVLDTIGIQDLLRMLPDGENRSACVKSVLAYHDPELENEKLFVGLCQGRIAEDERGENIRGWKVERIFIPNGFDKTLAEMDENEWIKFLDKFRKYDHYCKFGEWIEKQKKI